MLHDQAEEENYDWGEESDQPPIKPAGPPWKVLMVDDVPDVHVVTKRVMSEVSYKGRPIEFLSAYNSAEGRQMLAKHPDIAVVFLDVVMETDHSGLDLARYLRTDLNNRLVRIILRTGQPGQAPETQVILEYDINDYRHKAELSSERLFTTLIAALRGYEDLCIIEESRRGLQAILEGSSSLLKVHSTQRFLSGVLTQINAIFRIGSNAVLCVRSAGTTSSILQRIVAASGRFEALAGSTVEDAPPAVRLAIERAFSNHESLFEPNEFSIYFYSRDAYEIVIYIEGGKELSDFDIALVEVFCSTAAVGLNNIHLLETLECKVRDRTEELEHANAELRMLAMTDVLTGIANRRHILEFGESLLIASLRHDRPLALMLMDLDHFKQINDTWGHGAGDRALIAAAHASRDCLRGSDLIGRIGGEEFLVVCPETDAEGAHGLGERIRLAVSKLEIPGVPRQLTISIGFIIVGPADQSIELALKRADQGLYTAKTEGRNRVVGP